MKSHDDYFTNEKVIDLTEGVDVFFEKCKLELDEESDLTLTDLTLLIEKRKTLVQKAKALFIEDYFSNNPALFPLWKAMENKDLEAIKKAAIIDITPGQYLDTLAIGLLFNLDSYNLPNIEFLITKTELAQSNVFKAKVLDFFLIWYNELTQEGLNEGLLTFLTENNNWAGEVFFKNHHVFSYPTVSDKLLKIALDNIPDLNTPITVLCSDERGAYYEQASCLSLLLGHNRLELEQSLISKGAHLLPLEFVRLIYTDISDEGLIVDLKNMPNLMLNFKDLCIKRYGDVEEEGMPFLGHVITRDRDVLLQYLVDEGIDVNISWTTNKGDTCTPFHITRNIKLFEILIDSGKLIKHEKSEIPIRLEGGNWLDRRECYDLFVWKNKFKDSLPVKCNSLLTWVNNGEGHFVNNLFKAFKKIPCISEIKYLKEDYGWELTPMRPMQDIYGGEIIEQNRGLIDRLPKEIQNYFKANWYKSMLICNKFTDGSIFAIKDIIEDIGYFLLDSFIEGELLNSELIKATGQVTELPEDN